MVTEWVITLPTEPTEGRDHEISPATFIHKYQSEGYVTKPYSIVTRSGCWGFLLRLLPITETTLEYSLGPFILPKRKPSLHVQAI